MENIVNFIFIKRFSMKYFIEPEVLYNNEILVYRNKDVEQKILIYWLIKIRTIHIGRSKN